MRSATIAGKVYPLGLVGESNYQAAIRRARPGAAVTICREPDNPHDPHALRVDTSAGETLGYVPRESWLRDAIFLSNRGCTARIKAIEGTRGKLGVVIAVQLSDDAVPERGYAPTRPSPPGPSGSGGIAGLVRGFIRGLR